MSTIERETSRGRLQIVWGINRWVRVETDGGGVFQRRVRSWQQLQTFFEELGLPEDEALELAVREWGDRPPTAALSSGDTEFGPSRFLGLSAWVAFPVVLGLAALGIFATLHYWFLPALDKWRYGPHISRAADRPVAIRFVHAYYDIRDPNAAYRVVRQLSNGSIERSEFLEDRKHRRHPVSGPRPCGRLCFRFTVHGDPVPDPGNPGFATISFGEVDVYFRSRGHRPTVWGPVGFSGGFGGCRIGGNCKTVPERYRPPVHH
ncbi:MAG TPA: hypothetical protein VIW19_13795 [Gaiellaceae bacterium]